MKVIFLDIDGVLNSTKTSVAMGGFPMELHERDRFDWMAIKLLQRLSDSSGVQFVLSSAWRLYFSFGEVAAAFELPIIGATPNGSTEGTERGYEIRTWLRAHPEVTSYVILDDDPDMLEEQLPRFVKTDGNEGMGWKDFARVCELLGESPFAGEVRDRNWRGQIVGGGVA